MVWPVIVVNGVSVSVEFPVATPIIAANDALLDDVLETVFAVFVR